MIDNKKIEEAARGAADLYEQDLPMMSYDEDTEVDGQHHFCQEFGAELFKDGAKWAINEFLKDLWHPVSEEPEENKKLLVQYTNYDLETDYEVDMNTPFTEWKQHAVSYKFMKWCYIEDILPKGGEK